ncbi:MAG TPA: D-alanyl-D-alanine endopeptidase [Usitatibacter sp.]|jgi:D-alanyl-D-alanine endopeptidase (penicillin-binding protein 7)|nr:D-alanyl-D-alanine endopeptidase [Usitatibacter sp.]
MRNVNRLIALIILAALAVAAPVAEAAKGRAKVATAEFTKDGEPNVQSTGVLVFDPTTGQTLFSKNADQAAPIASITKLMTAMVVLDANLPMDEAIEITSDDIDLVKNTRSRLPIGSHFRRDDLMRLALMASDNRAASALGRTYPGGLEAAVTAMNAKAKVLGTAQTRYVDSSGLSPNNVSSPSDLGKIVAAATNYPLITEYTTTGAVSVTLPDSKRKLNFVNTNALVRHSDWKIGLSKTGYINEAGKCLVMQATIVNTPIVIVLLDSWGRLTRIADANRIRKWLERNPSKLTTSAVLHPG